MAKVAIKVPNEAYPKKDPVNPCPCQFRPMKLMTKKGIISWLKKTGDYVAAGEVVCEGEVEKKALEFCAPCNGTLIEVCIADEEQFGFGDILGYIEKMEHEENEDAGSN